MGIIAGNTQHGGRTNRGYAESWTREQVDSLLAEAWLKQLVAEIRAGDEKRKDQLPYICPHYAAFRDNHRAQKDIIPEAFTFMTCVDVDDKSLVDQAIRRAQEVNQDEYSDWQDQVLRIEYSARRKVHIYIRIPKGMTIEEAQQAFCKEIGVPYDESCITPERFIYVTGRDEEVYRSPHWLEAIPDAELEERREAYLQRGLDVDGRRATPLQLPRGGEKEASPRGGLEGVSARALAAFDETLAITGLTLKQLNRDGVRHNTLKLLLPTLCQMMAQQELFGVLAQKMPEYSQEQDCRTLVQNFYDKYVDQNRPMNQTQKEVFLRSLKATENYTAEPTPLCNSAPSIAININQLPVGLKESLKPYPQNMWPALIVGMMPALMALADGVSYRYCDGKIGYLGGMAIILGEQASNKSAIEEAVERWLVDLRREDEAVREREDKVREANKRRKANERAQEPPAGVVRVVPITISCSKLLKRLKQSQGHSLYSICTEAETLLKSNGSGTWAQKWDIYRNAFGRERWGVDFNSDQSESGDVKVAYSWTILGTPKTVLKMFKGRNESNAENGLSSRMMLSEMPDTMFAKITVFKDLTDADMERISQATALLRSASGFYDTPRLRKAVDKWLEEKRVESALDMDVVKDRFRRRAAVIGFRCGVVYMLLAGKESAACIDFALKMADYTLQMQLRVFGPLLAKYYANDGDQHTGATVNGSIFEQLPSTFELQHLRRLKGQEFSDGALYTIISRWKSEGWVEKTGKGKWCKRT